MLNIEQIKIIEETIKCFKNIKDNEVIKMNEKAKVDEPYDVSNLFWAEFGQRCLSDLLSQSESR